MDIINGHAEYTPFTESETSKPKPLRYIFNPNEEALVSITFRNESIHFLASVPNGAIPNSISTIVAVLSSFKNSFANFVSKGSATMQTKSDDDSYVICHLDTLRLNRYIAKFFNIID